MNCPKCNGSCRLKMTETVCTKCNWYTTDRNKTKELGIYDEAFKYEKKEIDAKELKRSDLRYLVLGGLIVYIMCAIIVISIMLIG